MKRNRFENEFERIRFENWNPGIDRLTQINSSYRSRRISTDYQIRFLSTNVFTEYENRFENECKRIRSSRIGIQESADRLDSS